MGTQKILIIEDEIKMADSIQLGLEEFGYISTVCNTGKAGLETAIKNRFNLILCDVILPELNGNEIVQQLRENGVDTPVIMLTALGSTDDKLTSFDNGVDDYITKPFVFKELIARIKAVLKRTEPTLNESNIQRVNDLVINHQLKTVERSGKRIELTVREFDLITYLANNKNKVVSKKEIAENVWDLHFDTGTNIIEVYVNYVRKKIDKDFDVKLIHTLHGRGYMLKEE